MNLKRILNLLLLVTLSLFVLSACSDESDDSSSRTGGDDSSIDWSTILGNSTNTGGSSTDTDSDTDTNSEEDGAEVESETDSEDESTETEEADTTDTETETDTDPEESTDTDTDTDPEEVVDSDSESETDEESETDSNTDDDEVAESVDNTFTITNLTIEYDGKSTSSVAGSGNGYYHNQNKLAIVYEPTTVSGTLYVVGKVEMVTSNMTNISELILNKLRYRYFKVSTLMSSDEFYNLYTDNGDNTYTFVFPFALSGDDEIVYSANSTNKLTYTLTKNGDFPRDVDSFIAASRSYTPLNYISSDPYSIQGTYKASDSCKGIVYSKGDVGTKTYGPYDLTISDIYAKIDESGSLTFSYDVSGWAFSIDGSMSFPSSSWWGNGTIDITASITSNYGYTGSHTLTAYSTSDGSSLIVQQYYYYSSISWGYIGNDATGTCYFEKQSDYIQ